MKKILVNKNLWQTRVAVLSDDRLQDIYFDINTRTDLERCFFKGIISKILPGIQTSFVDIGQPKAGFLHITEVDRELATKKITEYLLDASDDATTVSDQDIKSSLDMAKIFTEGQEVLVQVIKEPIHDKGAKLTTCFTLPGKFVVLMPNIPQVGISKKIENREEKVRLKAILQECLPPGMGAIIRTTAEDRSSKDIIKDVSFLIATWKSIQKKFKKAQPKEKIHEDLPVSLRAVRDHLDDEVEMVIVDDRQEQEAIYKFVKYVTPEQAAKVRFYSGPPSLFERYDIDVQVEKALQKKVPLKSGGSLIIESTEAMTVVDVNTGKFTGGGSSLEDTILKTNLEAADEVVTQLRLRNIGGLIVIDFIDMGSASHRQKLSRSLEKHLKEKDKYQSVALKISEFGLVQMTRKRSGKTLIQQLTNVCQACHGYGHVKSITTISFKILTQCQEEIIKMKLQGSLVLSLSHRAFDYLLHQEYQSILALEKQLSCKLTLESNEHFEDNQYILKAAQ